MRPCVELVMIMRHPPGLNTLVCLVGLVAVIRRDDGRWRCMILWRSYRILGCSVARLCSAMATMSAWRFLMLSKVGLNRSYPWYELIPCALAKNILRVLFGLAVVMSPMNSLSFGWLVSCSCTVNLCEVCVVVCVGGCCGIRAWVVLCLGSSVVGC